MRTASLALTLFALAALACDGDSPSAPTGTLAIVPESASMSEGASLQLEVVGPDGPLTGPVTWSSSRPAVADVSAQGLVTTRNELGSARITATLGAASAAADIDVSSDCAAPVAIAGSPAGDRELQDIAVTLAAELDVPATAQAMADFYGFVVEELLPDGFRAEMGAQTIASVRCRDEVVALAYAG